MVHRMGLTLLQLVFLNFVVTTLGKEGSKPVTVALNSGWARTPLLSEASEFFASQDAALFWRFVEETKNLYSVVRTEKDVYTRVLEIGTQFLPPLVQNLLKLSLSLHTYSPAVEMYNQVVLEHIGENASCSALVEANGQLACSLEELGALRNQSSGPVPDQFQFDHVYPSLGAVQPQVVVALYGQLGSPEFAVLHDTLASMATEGRIRYIFRHYTKPSASRTRLSGYGVQLAIKSTEYKAVDDRQVQEGAAPVLSESNEEDEVEGFLFSKLKSLHPDVSDKLDDFRTHLIRSSRELPDLKAWQLQDLGLQAAQRVVSSGPEQALRVLRDLAQNLPVQARSLWRSQVDSQLRTEVQYNQQTLAQIGVNPGDVVLQLNNIVLRDEDLDVFNLQDVLRSEASLITGFQSLRIPTVQWQNLLRLSGRSESVAFGLDVRNESAIFVNDLERDKAYASWPSSVRDFLRPMFPGMLRQVAKNVFTVVFFVDPATDKGLEIVEYIKLFLDHSVPLRMGLVLVTGDSGDREEISVALARGFYHLAHKSSPREAVRWLLELQSLGLSQLTRERIVESFGSTFGSKKDDPDLQSVFGDGAPYEGLRKKASEFFHAKGLSSLPQAFFNGIQLNLEEDLESSLVNKLQQQSMMVAQLAYQNKIDDSINLYDYFMEASHVLKRTNRHILSNSGGKQLDMLTQPAPSDVPIGRLTLQQAVGEVVRDMKYLHHREGEFVTKLETLWVLADVGSEQGRNTLLTALRFLSTQPALRVGVVYNPVEVLSHVILSRAVWAAIHSQHPQKVAALIEALLRVQPVDSIEGVVRIAQELEGINVDKFKQALENPASSEVVRRHSNTCRMLGLSRGVTALVSNGRLIGPLEQKESFVLLDFDLLFKLEQSSHVGGIMKVMDGLVMEGLDPDEDTSEFRSDLVMKLVSLLHSQPARHRVALPALNQDHSYVHITPAIPGASLEVMAYLDPLSSQVQRIVPLLHTLHSVLAVDIHLYLNPQHKLSELPIKSFYRYVIEPELTFNEDGSLTDGPMAVFSSLPHSSLLTLKMDVPHSWMVTVETTPHDLDNIHLASVDHGIHAVFNLEHILVEGQCSDSSTDSPVPGLQLILGTDHQPEVFDTIVMANLGYYQLKATPGVWTLRLREGRSSEIYDIISYQGADRSQRGDILVSVNSFKGVVMVVRVARKSGMESANLLSDPNDLPEGDGEEEEQGGLWNTVSNFLGGEEGKKRHIKAETTANETINIFSLASGHLYERFLRIMMLSVLKHTRNPVKFWFLKNFLSPTFKSFIPHMAKHYGFQYQLVEYKWPRWLHQQTEKQRIIWGYKILFLDVLFSLNVRKIIFVDADQVVRTDLKELLEIPLHGAPYGYTPFCDSRPEMEGFKFWKKGYWYNHLGNRKYHISALYVVDLLRFRQLAAGDRLRGQYQALSQDPNSLANLDQDLPNNMIHQVPIASLPQEWLWCETWCSNESKPQAKTIDLCNNPMTKEPKLVSAVRIIPEWTAYDKEASSFQEKVMEQEKSHKDVHIEL